MMSAGCDGTISVASNCVPDRAAKLVNLCAAGKMKEALKMHEELEPLFRMLFCETNPIPLKYIMAKMGYGSGVLRLPLTELTDKNHAAVDAVMKDMGMIT
jgi:4-hydroxy-tetrahydrodipicolinate synthase